jgi:hypothetical protein
VDTNNYEEVSLFPSSSSLRPYAVRSGAWLKAVVAHDPEEAACVALRQFAAEHEGTVPACLLGKIIIVAEEGRPFEDNFIGRTRDSLERAGVAVTGAD